MKLVLCSVLLAFLAMPSRAEPPPQELPPGIPPDFPIDQFDFNPFEVVLPEDLPEERRPQAELRGAQVPYSLRVKALFGAIGAYAEIEVDPSSEFPNPLHVALSTFGLDPQSKAARELVAISSDFRQWYIPTTKAALRTGSLEHQHQTQRQAAHVAGQKFGKWLSAREAEDWAITPLVERLLNNQFSSMATMSSHQTQEELEKETAELAESFRQGLQEELGWIPRRFQ